MFDRTVKHLDTIQDGLYEEWIELVQTIDVQTAFVVQLIIPGNAL